MSTIRLVVAMAEDGTIGHHGKLPWHLPADLAHFKKVTYGSALIMGRKTFESIGRPLPGRTNIVVSSRYDWHADGVMVARDVMSAVRDAATAGENPCIIGGRQVYSAALSSDVVDELIVTHVYTAPAGDTRFPVIDWSPWYEWERIEYPSSDPAFDVVTYRRSVPREDQHIP